MSTLFVKKFIQYGCFFASLLVVVAQAQAETYYFHNDHLGTPQVVTNSNEEVVWKGEYDPFGECIEVVDLIEQNLRLPGQYFDQETGLHYNFHRTYDPNTGRYIESDPVGLKGGINTYGYAFQNSIRYTDPTGEFVPLIVLIPVFSGLINGVIEELEDAVQCDSGPAGSLRAFGRGFAAGAAGSLAGLGVFALSGNVVAAGAAGGVVGASVDQAISGNGSRNNIIVSGVTGAIAGPVARKVVPLVPGGRPSLKIPRGITVFGENSFRMIGQDSVFAGIAGGAGTILQPNEGCECN